jgi:DNA-binding MarR family transcriptional regulator
MNDWSIASQIRADRHAEVAAGEILNVEPVAEFRSRTRYADIVAVRGAIHARAERARHFNSELFADPAWDMLLELYAATLTQRKLTISRLAERSHVPMTTSLRWINTLEREGLIERGNDRLDARRVFIILTPKGEQAMSTFFDELPAGTLFL